MKKSDAQLQQDIFVELKWEPSINAAEIGVEVWSERELARNTAWGMPGVRSVVDNTTMSY